MVLIVMVEGMSQISLVKMTFMVGYCNCTRRYFYLGIFVIMLRSVTFGCCMWWWWCEEQGSRRRVTTAVWSKRLESEQTLELIGFCWWSVNEQALGGEL